jgi:hypothetical protein
MLALPDRRLDVRLSEILTATVHGKSVDAFLSDYKMNNGTGECFDGVGIFAVEEIKIESRQSEQCYRRTADHGEPQNALLKLQLRKYSMLPC